MNKHPKLLIIYLALLGAITPMSTDIYLSSMPIIQKYFVTSTYKVQLTLSLFFLSFAISQLFWGPLSDKLGRKPVIYLGGVVFILGSLMCVLSQNIEFFIVSRIIQAFGACSAIVMSFSIVKDCFEGEEMVRSLSAIISVTILAPVIAPIIGGYMLLHINWQANFYLLMAYGLILILGAYYLDETYPKDKRQELSLKILLPAYYNQLKFTPFLLSASIVSTNFAILFTFIASSPFVYIEIYHLGTEVFGYLFALNAIALTFGTVSLKKLKNIISEQKILVLALVMEILGSLIFVGGLYFNSSDVLSVIIPVFIVSYGVGILLPLSMSYAMVNVVKYVGMTSSLTNSMRFSVAALIGWLIGLCIQNTAWPLAWFMLGLSILTALLSILYFKVGLRKNV